MIGPINRKNWLTFGGGPVPDTVSGSFFHFPQYCEIEDFSRILIPSPADFQDTRRNLMIDAD